MNKYKKQKVIVAMSGGVDSSVAAKLLVDQGFEVMGIFLHFWKDKKKSSQEISPEIVENKCCSIQALMDARRVCRKINIPLYTLNFSDIFKKEIVDNFLSEYNKGNTPNPCVRCNKFVKLGLLIKKAKELGFDYVASGHYSINKKPSRTLTRQAGMLKIKNEKLIYKLSRAKDKAKDQSYFLYTLTQDQLKHLIFPLGNYTKDEVRKLAKKFSLPVAEKSDSQEICFIPGKSHNEFLKKYLKLKTGEIKTIDGKIIGKHQGLPLYTIGQRKGVEIGGIGPFYVAKCDYKTNTLYVVSDSNDPCLHSDELIARNVNWIQGKNPKMPLKCKAVIRYHHKPVECIIKPSKIKTEYIVKFKKPQRAITLGQSVVFYNNNEVLGGGIIT